MLLTFLLSKRARQVLRDKARQYKLPRRVLLDAMITEFATSAPAEKAAWEPARRQQAQDWAAHHPLSADDPFLAYSAGHRQGWEDYQVRRADTFINLVRQAQGFPRLGVFDG